MTTSRHPSRSASSPLARDASRSPSLNDTRRVRVPRARARPRDDGRSRASTCSEKPRRRPVRHPFARVMSASPTPARDARDAADDADANAPPSTRRPRRSRARATTTKECVRVGCLRAEIRALDAARVRPVRGRGGDAEPAVSIRVVVVVVVVVVFRRGGGGGRGGDDGVAIRIGRGARFERTRARANGARRRMRTREKSLTRARRRGRR